MMVLPDGAFADHFFLQFLSCPFRLLAAKWRQGDLDIWNELLPSAFFFFLRFFFLLLFKRIDRSALHSPVHCFQNAYNPSIHIYLYLVVGFPGVNGGIDIPFALPVPHQNDPLRAVLRVKLRKGGSGEKTFNKNEERRKINLRSTRRKKKRREENKIDSLDQGKDQLNLRRTCGLSCGP